jgi:hypothetical protein
MKYEWGGAFSMHGEDVRIDKKHMVRKQNGKEAYGKFILRIIYKLNENEDKRACCVAYLVLIQACWQ